MKRIQISTVNGELVTLFDEDAEKADYSLTLSYRHDWGDVDLKWGESDVKIFTKYIVSIRKSGDWRQGE